MHQDTDVPTLRFACPHCAGLLGPMLACADCGRAYTQRDGIYRFLLPERQQALAPFLELYRRVRDHDGYRSQRGAYYCALPEVPADDPQAATWRLRAATFAAMLRQARFAPTPARSGLDVLDLGAGNGWLSNRLSALGHQCVAVDLLDDSGDGLGAAQHYTTHFTRLQADFDRLPLRPAQFDRVVYNGALHYSAELEFSLRHGLSMLRPGGLLAILDSPTFRSKASAEQMVAAQAQRHQAAAGTQDMPRTGQGYLVAGELMEIGIGLGLPLRYWPTRGSLTWSLRRRLAGIKLRRETASFGLWLGVKPS